MFCVERPNVLRTFVYAPVADRIEFAQKSAPMPRRCPTACGKAQLAKHDRARASYYNYYTENRWGEAKNYDLCLNAALGLDTCADLIVDAASRHEQVRSVLLCCAMSKAE